MIHKSSSVEETQKIAAGIAAQVKPGGILCLCGELGAGKTAFAQGFAKGMGYTGYVNSPTFTLLQIYEGGRLPIYHFDLYRLEGQLDEGSLEEIGFFDCIDGTGLCLIEWANYAREYIPKEAAWLEIRRVANGSLPEEREIHVLGL